uniref:CSON010626 protein n=1 Tax=Culicoides sonorensis TaxID=179676 RepID=A0A336KHL5_CULSO
MAFKCIQCKRRKNVSAFAQLNITIETNFTNESNLFENITEISMFLNEIPEMSNSSNEIYDENAKVFLEPTPFQRNLIDLYMNDDISPQTKETLNNAFNVNNSVGIGLTLIHKNLTTWPTKHVANVEGDIILGGLMMVHEREDSIICGPIMAQGGIQALETMLFTLDYINRVGLLPNISIGAHILDDCDKVVIFVYVILLQMLNVKSIQQFIIHA